MIGVVLVSHSGLAEQLRAAAQMIFGTLDEQVVALGLGMEENPDDFSGRLKNAVTAVDSGDGVVILADLWGGTPFNRAAMLAGERVVLITGVNLPLVLELLSRRMAGEAPYTPDLIELAQSGITVYTPDALSGDDEIL